MASYGPLKQSLGMLHPAATRHNRGWRNIVLAMVAKSVTTAGIAPFPGEASAKQYSG